MFLKRSEEIREISEFLEEEGKTAAMIYGIRVEAVDARYTSQRCSACGTIDKASRKGNRYTCRHCGNNMHADTNAAINIRDKYITRVMHSGQAAVNQPGEPSGHPASGWGALGRPETEPVGSLWIKRSRPSLQACLKVVD